MILPCMEPVGTGSDGTDERQRHGGDDEAVLLIYCFDTLETRNNNNITASEQPRLLLLAGAW